MTAEAMSLQQPPQDWTVDDLDRLPADGNRYELIDGVVSVAPSPSMDHQDVAGNLWIALRRAAPREVSPSTRSADRLTKPALYAAAGIPNYWRVELDPLHIVVYKLDEDGTYGELARGEVDVPLSVPVPFPIDLAPSDLLG